jgi:hypothetical protein
MDILKIYAIIPLKIICQIRVTLNLESVTGVTTYLIASFTIAVPTHAPDVENFLDSLFKRLYDYFKLLARALESHNAYIKELRNVISMKILDFYSVLYNIKYY